MLPLRRPVANVVHAVATGEGRLIPRQGKERPFLLRHGPFVAAAVLIAVAALGYGARALQDHGKVAAARRTEAFYRKRPSERPPPEYPAASVRDIASGHYTATHAAVFGDVTQVSNELDGDIHLRIEAGGAFVVAEIIPEFPLSLPTSGSGSRRGGSSRHDGLHNWWELHPLIGWYAGNRLGLQQRSPTVGFGGLSRSRAFRGRPPGNVATRRALSP